jgi:triacylglycerol lipase
LLAAKGKFFTSDKNNTGTMIASLQRFLLFSAVAGVVLGFAAFAFAGHWWLAVVIGVLLLGGYAAVLALEFCLLRWASANDPSPTPSFAQLCRAWWSEVNHAPRVFAWRQPFCSERWPDHLPVATQDRRGVLLVHGFFCNRGLWNLWLARLTALNIPVVAVTLEPAFGAIDAYASTIEAAIQQLHHCTGQAPVVVAHSMGGLATRRWWADQADPARIHRLITLGTPHQGTWLAGLAFSVNGRQMRLQSRWLQTLARREPAGRAQSCTCFYSHCDNIVFPPSTATLVGADNRHLTAVAHVHMVDHPEPWAETLLRLSEVMPSGAPGS